MATKVCITCNVEKPETLKYFPYRRDSDKFNNKCRACQCAYQKKYKRRLKQKAATQAKKMGPQERLQTMLNQKPRHGALLTEEEKRFFHNKRHWFRLLYQTPPPEELCS